MGNNQSSPSTPRRNPQRSNRVNLNPEDRDKYRAFPGSAFLEKTFCGAIDTTDPSEYEGTSLPVRLMKKADVMCLNPDGEGVVDDDDDSSYDDDDDDDDDHHDGGNSNRRDSRDSNNNASNDAKNMHPSSALLARALVSEVTDNPKTMKPAAMAQREYKLMKAQRGAERHNQQPNGDDPNNTRSSNNSFNNNNNSKKNDNRPIGAPGGVGPPQVFQSVAYACTGDETAAGVCLVGRGGDTMDGGAHELNGGGGAVGTYTVTIGLSMSRKHAIGHPATVTRQTAYDWNELQDRQYKYVSSTDKYGWRAGGGEKGGDAASAIELQEQVASPSTAATASKEPYPDMTHIPIIQIDCPSEQCVDQVIHVLASGDIFIPHMAVQPEALSVNGVSPPDLVVRFGCERNEDLPPDEWPNWALEFMHNQLYEYFYNNNNNPNTPTPRWMKRPFHITLAKKVRWKTVKHMNRYFAHAERVLDSWREKGPQYSDPQLPHIEGGASPEEVAHPHGIYLFRNGIPTNYFGPNFEPPYTTKMTRSLLSNVLDKSWDKKRREWSGQPIPRLVTPSALLAVACGCADTTAPGGFLARNATEPSRATLPVDELVASTSLEQVQNELHFLEADGPSSQRQIQQQQEEKKIESDEQELHHRVHQGGSRPHRQPQASPRASVQVMHDESSNSIAGGYAVSAAAESGTATTVVHTNLTAGNNGIGKNNSRTPRGSDMQMLPSPRNAALQGSSPHSSTNSSKSPIFASGPLKKKKGGKAALQQQQQQQHQVQQQRMFSPRQSQQLSPQHEQQEVLVEERTHVVGLASSPNHGGRAAAASSLEMMMNDPPGNKVNTVMTAAAELDRERQHHTELIAKAKQQTTSPPRDVASGTPTATSPTKYKLAGSLSSGSAISLDYSTDGSSAFFTEGSSLLGGQFANVEQQGSQTPSSAGLQHQRPRPRDPDAHIGGSSRVDNDLVDDDQDSLSLQESTSSIVPTDEDLFAIGWAKAVDPNSGNYYFFSLDRSKTVWENPLTHGVTD